MSTNISAHYRPRSLSRPLYSVLFLHIIGIGLGLGLGQCEQAVSEYELWRVFFRIHIGRYNRYINVELALMFTKYALTFWTWLTHTEQNLP